MEKRTKAMEPGHPLGTMKTNQIPTAAYNIKEWMRGLEEDASEVEVRNGEVNNCGAEQRNAYSHCMGRSRRQHRRKGTHNY